MAIHITLIDVCLGNFKFVNALPASIFAQALGKSHNAALVETTPGKTGFIVHESQKCSGESSISS